MHPENENVDMEKLNLESIEKMIDNEENYIDVHMHIFFYLCKFYCENVPKKESDAFIKKMLVFSKDTKHSFLDHMRIFGELLSFYKQKSEYSDFAKLQTISLSFLDSVRDEITLEKKAVKQ